jgi:Bacteriophage HK97-gp10, putative tail-component
VTAAATFKVTNPRARRYVVAPEVRKIAGTVAARAAANTPHRTGLLAASWHTVPGADPGTTLVTTAVPYARFVEYGTRYMRGAAPLGRALATGGR